MLPCWLLGHRFRFTTSGSEMRRSCQRGRGAGGAECYRTHTDARRYAAAFDREDRENLGQRAPLIGLLPVRTGRAVRDQRRLDKGDR